MKLLKNIAMQDVAWLPQPEFVTAQTLGNNNGAFGVDGDGESRIFINEDLPLEAQREAYLEEAGHFFDVALLGSGVELDTFGDEGELFRLALTGELYSDDGSINEDLANSVRAASADAKGEITVNGETLAVEFMDNPANGEGGEQARFGSTAQTSFSVDGLETLSYEDASGTTHYLNPNDYGPSFLDHLSTIDPPLPPNDSNFFSGFDLLNSDDPQVLNFRNAANNYVNSQFSNSLPDWVKQMIREFMAERGYNIVEPDYTNLPEAAYQRQDIQLVGGGEHNFQGSVADLVVADDQKYTYHPNGKVETLNKYIDGELARTTTYDETGNAQSRTDYEMFQRNGQTLTRESIFDLDGDTATPRGEIVKDAAGNIIEETTYFDANSPEGQDGIEARKTVYEQEGDLRKATATDLVDSEWQIREEAWTDSSGFQTKRTDFIDGAKTLETTFVKNNSGSEAGTESLRSGETVFFGPPGQEAKRSVTVFDTGPGNNIISVTQFDGAPGAETVVNTLNFGDLALPTNTVNTGGISSDLVWENDVPGAQSWTNRIMRQGHNVRLPDNFWADAGGQLAMTPEERANFLGFEGDNFEPTPGGKRIVGPDGATVVIDEPTIAIWQQRLSQAGTTVTDLMKGLGDIVYGFGEGIVKGSVGDIVELIDYLTKNGVDETIDHAGKLFLNEFTQTVNSFKRTAVNAALPKLLRQVDDGVLRLLGEDVVEARLRAELGRKFDADYRHNITLTDLEASPSTISENPDDLFKRLVPDIVDARADELFRGRIDNIIAGMDDEFVNLVGEDALRRQLRNELNDSVKHEMKTLAADSFTSSDGILDFDAVDNALRQGADKYKTAGGLSLTESVKTNVISDRVNAVTSGLDIDALKNMPSSYYDDLAEGLSGKLGRKVTKEAAIEMFSNVAKAAGPVGLVAGIVVDLGLGTADLVKAINNGGDPVEIVRALTATVGLDIVFDLGAAVVGWVSDNAQEIINVGNDVIDVLDVTDDKRLVDVLFGWIYGG